MEDSVGKSAPSGERRRLVWNSISGALLLVVQIGVALVLSPFLIMELGNRDYGIWELLLGLVGYMGLLDVGIQPALVRYVANAEASGNSRDLGRLLSTGMALLFVTGLVGGCVLASLGFAGQTIFNIVEQPSWLLLAFALMGLLFFASFVMSGFSAHLMGLQRYGFVNSVRIFAAIVQAAAVYVGLVVLDVPGLVWIACVHVSMMLLEILVFRAALLRIHPDLRVRRSHINRSVASQLFRFGLKNSIIMAAADLLRRAIPLIIAHTISVATVPFFAIPGRLLEYSRGLVIALGYPLTAHFAGLSVNANQSTMQSEWKTTTRILQMPAVILAIGIVGLGPAFLGWWIGPEFERNGRVVLYWLAIALLAEGLACNAYRILQGYNVHGRAATLSAIASPIALVGAIVFTELWGLAGAAAALALFMLVKAVGELYFATRQIALSLFEHLWLSLRWNLAPAAAATGAMIWAAPEEGPYNVFEILGAGVLTAFVFVVIWLLTSFSSQERRQAFREISARLMRFVPARSDIRG